MSSLWPMLKMLPLLLNTICIIPPGEYLFNYIDKPDFDMNTLVAAVRRILGKSGKVFHWPYWMGFADGLCFDLLAKIMRKKLPISSIQLKKFCAHTLFDSTAYSHPLNRRVRIRMHGGGGNEVYTRTATQIMGGLLLNLTFLLMSKMLIQTIETIGRARKEDGDNQNVHSHHQSRFIVIHEKIGEATDRHSLIKLVGDIC